MLKKLLILVFLLVILGIIAAPMLIDSDKADAHEEETSERKVELVEKKVEEPVEEMSLIDLNGVPEGETAPPHAYDWVSDMVEEMSKPHSEVDDGYNMYLKSQAIADVVTKYRVEGTALHRDFTNLWRLSVRISHDQFVRTSDIDPTGKAKDKVEFADQWKPSSERAKQAYEYMKQILHDLDVAFNKRGNGETYGVTYSLEGDKINELKSFMEGDGGE